MRNRVWEGLGVTCPSLQKSLFPPACLLRRLCVPSAAVQHLDLCLALSMLRRQWHHSQNTVPPAPPSPWTTGKGHSCSSQELCPADTRLSPGDYRGQIWKPSEGAEMLQEMGGEGQEPGVCRCAAASVQKLQLSAANRAEEANPVAVGLLQGELNWEQMCGSGTSR